MQLRRLSRSTLSNPHLLLLQEVGFCCPAVDPRISAPIGSVYIIVWQLFALVNLPVLFGLIGDLPEELVPILFQPNPMMLLFLCIGVDTAATRLR